MSESSRPQRRASQAGTRRRARSEPAAEFVPLLAAKLLPPTAGPLQLDRPRLIERLATGLEGKASFVLAGPGYGKTSLAARFFRGLEGEGVWYWLDRTDRDPWVFFRYLVQGVREHVPEFGERSETLWRDLRARPFEVERLADTFMSDAEESLGGRLVLVLDGIESLEGSDLCERVLGRLLTYLPGTLHLLLVGRTSPDVGLKGLLAEGSAALLEGDDLLFTVEETQTLLVETFGLKVLPETVRKAHARTRGWVTALQLLRQTARLEPGAPDLPEPVFAKTESEISDYFSEEVFAAEPEDVRELLLGSSPPALVDPDLCAEVLSDRGGPGVRAVLAKLLKRRLFLSPLESQGGYYAYDPLFLDFLRRKLRHEKSAAERRDLDMRYGSAFARRGAFTQALAHWIAAGNAEGIAGLLARHGKSLLHSGALDVVLQAAQFLTEAGMRSAVVEDLTGEAHRLAGDHAAAIGHFERALSRSGDGGPDLSGPARASTLQGLAHSLLKMGDTTRAAEIADRARAEAGDEDLALIARILNVLSIIRYRENRLKEAVEGWQEALARAREAGDEHLVFMIAHNLGLPHAARGDFRRASECFQILTGPDNFRLGPEEGAAYLNLARIATLQGDHARAAATLGDAREIARKWRLTSLTADVLEAEGTLLRETGDHDGAAERYERARSLFTELGRGELLSNLAEEEAILAALRGRSDEAVQLASRLAESARAAGDREALGSSLLALGEVRARAGDQAGAAEALAESASLFESLDRSYQHAMARLWLAFSCWRGGDAPGAREDAVRALHLAAQYGYRAAVLRVARLDPEFHRYLYALPAAAGLLPPPEPAPEASPPVHAAPILPDADLTVRLFGPIEVYRDEGRKIPLSAWKIRRALQLFCVLASSRGRRATKDRIVDALWGSARPSVIDRNFHPTISFLRRALNHGHNVPKNFVIFEKGAYLLNPAYRYDIDVERFDERVVAAKAKHRRRDAAGALEDYEVALTLYRGPFLEEDYEEWTEGPRAHYDELYLGALAEAGALHIGAGDAEAGLEILKRLVEREPLDESASRALMGALGGRGQRAAVEREYARLAQALEKELEVAPMAETRRAYESALAAASVPGTGTPARASGPAPRPRSAP